MQLTKDGLEHRCPRLGGTITFGYCRTSGGEEELPCWKIFDCWWEIFDVANYLKQSLPEDKFDRIANTQPKPKIASLLEIIEQAKKNAAMGESD
ncbi:hypothetical protein ACFL9U_07490 [Thermodesulfobacteriota bacterium]